MPIPRIDEFDFQFRGGRGIRVDQLYDPSQQDGVPRFGAGAAPPAIGRVAVNPGRIAAAADLDGTYECIVTLTDAEVAQLNDAKVNYLEIWFGTETVHVVSPWAPAIATRVDAVVDTTEESQIGAPGNALAVRSVYRINESGLQRYYAEGAGALRIGGYDATAAGDDLQSVTVGSLASFNSALTAQETADTPLEIVFSQQVVLTSGPNAGTYAVGDVVFVAARSTSIERRFNAASHANLRDEAELRQKGDTIISSNAANADQLGAILRTVGDDASIARITAGFTTDTRTYATGQRWYLAPHHTTEANLVLLSEAGSDLTQAQQVGLLQWAPEPAVIGYRTEAGLAAEAKTVKLGVLNPELLTDDIWVEGWTQGQRGFDRTKWSSLIDLTITISDGWATAVANNIATDGDGELEVRLRFFDAASGGNEIERIGINIPIVDLRAIKTRFESAVGASPAVLPAGTHTLYINGDVATNYNIPTSILLSELGSSDLGILLRGNGGTSQTITLSYVAATRTLTYTVDRRTASIKAVGEA